MQLARIIRRSKLYWTLHHIKHRNYATEHCCYICKFQAWNYLRKDKSFGKCEDCKETAIILKCNEANNEPELNNHCEMIICEPCFYKHVEAEQE